MSDMALKSRNVSLRSPGVACGEVLTSSNMAQPIMFSATTTGPETEKMEPCSCSSFEAMVEVDCVEGEDMEVVGMDEAGESGSGGSSGGDGDDGLESSSRLRISSSNDDRAFSCGLPKPNMNHMGIV